MIKWKTDDSFCVWFASVRLSTVVSLFNLGDWLFSSTF